MAGSNEVKLLTVEEWEAWREGDDEDIRLAHACLNAQFELRDLEWTALELLGVAMAPEPEPATPEATTGAAGAEGGTGAEGEGEMVAVNRRELAALARGVLDGTAPGRRACEAGARGWNEYLPATRDLAPRVVVDLLAEAPRAPAARLTRPMPR